MHWYSYYSTAVCKDTVAQKEGVILSIAAQMLKRNLKCVLAGPICQRLSLLCGRSHLCKGWEARSETKAWSQAKGRYFKGNAHDCLSTILEPMQLRLHFAIYLSFCALRSSHDPAPRLSLELSDPRKLLTPGQPSPSPFFPMAMHQLITVSNVHDSE